MRSAGSSCIGNSAMAASSPDGSRVRRESHARFWERLEVKSLRPIHSTIRLLAKGKCTTGRIWTYMRDDGPYAGPGRRSRSITPRATNGASISEASGRLAGIVQRSL